MPAKPVTLAIGERVTTLTDERKLSGSAKYVGRKDGKLRLQHDDGRETLEPPRRVWRIVKGGSRPIIEHAATSARMAWDSTEGHMAAVRQAREASSGAECVLCETIFEQDGPPAANFICPHGAREGKREAGSSAAPLRFEKTTCAGGNDAVECLTCKITRCGNVCKCGEPCAHISVYLLAEAFDADWEGFGETPGKAAKVAAALLARVPQTNPAALEEARKTRDVEDRFGLLQDEARRIVGNSDQGKRDGTMAGNLSGALSPAEKRAVRSAANFWYAAATTNGQDPLPRGMITQRRELVAQIIRGDAYIDEALPFIEMLAELQSEEAPVLRAIAARLRAEAARQGAEGKREVGSDGTPFFNADPNDASGDPACECGRGYDAHRPNGLGRRACPVQTDIRGKRGHGDAPRNGGSGCCGATIFRGKCGSCIAPVAEGKRETDDRLPTIFRAAKAHGDASEADHEVGDLIDILIDINRFLPRAAGRIRATSSDVGDMQDAIMVGWQRLDNAQKQAVYDDAMKRGGAEWLDGEGKRELAGDNYRHRDTRDGTFAQGSENRGRAARADQRQPAQTVVKSGYGHQGDRGKYEPPQSCPACKRNALQRRADGNTLFCARCGHTEPTESSDDNGYCVRGCGEAATRTVKGRGLDELAACDEYPNCRPAVGKREVRDRHYVNRNVRTGEYAQGATRIGRSLRADRRELSQTVSKPGYGDRGDQGKRASPICGACEGTKMNDGVCQECGSTTAPFADGGNAGREGGVWWPASGGREEPFRARNGANLLYCWNPTLRQHAYVDLDRDMVLSNEEARAAIGG